MSTICPKCSHQRQPDTVVPDWQCPSCGVCYAKVKSNPRVHQPETSSSSRSVASAIGSSSLGRLLVLAAIVGGTWLALHARTSRHAESPVALAASGDNMTTESLAALAATVKPGDVVMYTTTECPYCAQAKDWLNQYGFAYTECNMSVNKQCESDFKRHGAIGTPYLIVRGHHMKDGFDSDEFIAALKQG